MSRARATLRTAPLRAKLLKGCDVYRKECRFLSVHAASASESVNATDAVMLWHSKG